MLFGVVEEPQGDRAAGGLRDGGHVAHCAAPPPGAVDTIPRGERMTPVSSGPVHASWLNQIEIFFSVIQTKVVTPNDFHSLEQLSRTLLAFIDRYNQTARPFSGNSPPATCTTS